jgi:head-tail adaptor
MSPIPSVAAGQRLHLVTLQNPTTTAPDGDGGYTQTWTDLAPPKVFMSINAASARDLEYLASGTVAASATHLLRGPFHPGVTTQTRVLFGARTFHVASVRNPEERSIEMILVCEEQVA